MYGVQLETEQAIEEDSNSSLSGLLEEYGNDARKYIYDYDTDGLKYINLPKKIVVHHTGGETCDPTKISNQHKNDPKKGTNGMNTSTKKLPAGLNKTGGDGDGEYSDVRYHYIVQADGTIDNVRYESEVGRGTKVNNIDVIHIAFCGNFNDHEPTPEQYKEGGKLIGEIRERIGTATVYGHGQLAGEATDCPGKLFDYERLSFFTPFQDEEKIIKKTSPGKVEVKKQGIPTEGLLGEFNITRYYSCDPNQTRYIPREVNVLKKKIGRDPSLQELYTECNRRQFNGDNDNTQPKHGARFTNADAGIAVACPKSVPGWTKLKIEGYNQEVVCRDVGSAITAGRLDLYVGIGDRAVDNYNNFPSGKRKIYIIDS